MDIILLGASGYIGSALLKELTAREIETRTCRSFHDYVNENYFESLITKATTHVINAAAFIPQPSVDECKKFPGKTWEANVQFPAMLARVCNEHNVHLCHISTGCLYHEGGYYHEDDPPTRFDKEYARLYVVTKYLSEVAVKTLCPKSYVWRIRLPFDEVDHPRNFLTKIQRHEKVWSHSNSLTHRGDFAKAAIDMIKKNVAPGVYHMTNPGAVSTLWVINQMRDRQIIDPLKPLEFVPGPVTGTLLSVDKLLRADIYTRHGVSAVANALNNWKKAA